MQSQIYYLHSHLKGKELESMDIVAFLSQAERDKFKNMRFSKRRNEWLHGRYAAKELLKRSSTEFAGLSYDEITIANEEEGAPYYMIGSDDRLSASLSISHRDDIAFCSLATDANNWLGVDVEKVELRGNEFIEDFFTSGEINQLNTCQSVKRSLYVNLIWSAKEALLKSLHRGLHLDTRMVEIVSIEGLDDVTSQNWQRMFVQCHINQIGKWSVWWRADQKYVFTLAVWWKDGMGQSIPLYDVSTRTATIQKLLY